MRLIILWEEIRIMYSNHQWNEADHPRDDDGKFTFKNGGSNSNTKESAASVLYKDSKIKE